VALFRLVISWGTARGGVMNSVAVVGEGRESGRRWSCVEGGFVGRVGIVRREE
jgi:hypothetical protein